MFNFRVSQRLCDDCVAELLWLECPHRQRRCYRQPHLSTWRLPLIKISYDYDVIIYCNLLLGCCFFSYLWHILQILTFKLLYDYPQIISRSIFAENCMRCLKRNKTYACTRLNGQRPSYTRSHVERGFGVTLLSVRS